MQVTETLSDGLKRGFTVVLPAADLESRRAKRLAELGKNLKLPGFRPGKVPLPVVRQRYGTAVRAEILEDSVNEATDKVLSDRGLRPAQKPKVDVVSSIDAQDQDFEFKVEVELLPDITLPDLGAIALTRLKAAPDPAAIDRAIEQIASRNKDFVDVAEIRPAAAGDHLVVDFVGSIDGVAFPGGAGTDINVEVAGPGFIPGFTEQLVGLSPGEARTITVTFPAEYQAAELAGKEASFDITAKALKQAVTPAVDDALASKLGLENLQALRTALTDQTRHEFEQMSRVRLKRQLLDALNGLASFPVPQTMLDTEFNQIWQRVEADRKDGKVDDDDAGKDDDTLRAEYRAIAERRVRLGLLLAEIGRVNAIVVGQDEMLRAMRTEARRYQGQEQQVMEFFRKNPQAAEGLRGPLFEEKVVDFVLELANVTEQVVTPEELVAEPPADLASAAPPLRIEEAQMEGTPSADAPIGHADAGHTTGEAA
jgi:trigger factor